MKKRRMTVIAAVGILASCLMAGGRVEAGRQTSIVGVPQDLNFYLDPENENGMGQIYSDMHEIWNEGTEPVEVSVALRLSVLDETSSIAFSPVEWDTEPEYRSIYMYALFEDAEGEEECVLTDSMTPCVKTLWLAPAGMEGDTASIRFEGSLSSSEEWKSGELGIDCVYSISGNGAGYQAVINGSHIRISSGGDQLKEGERAELYLTPDEGYVLPAEVRVYMGGAEAAAAYNAAEGKVTLDAVTGDIVICADGVTRAMLPDAGVFDPAQAVWRWAPEEGVQAYDYRFERENETVESGRISAEGGFVDWYWSQGLEDGAYQLYLRAIGDTVSCLNSEEGCYWILVNKALFEGSGNPDSIAGQAQVVPDSAGEPGENGGADSGSADSIVEQAGEPGSVEEPGETADGALPDIVTQQVGDPGGVSESGDAGGAQEPEETGGVSESGDAGGVQEPEEAGARAAETGDDTAF